MTKRAISVTLDGDNLTWLKGRAGAGDVRSVSELLNQLVTAARQGGYAGVSRSVMNTIKIDAADPGLDHADAAVRALFDASVARPFFARERPPVRSRLGRSARAPKAKKIKKRPRG
jgi:hypothetical protein